MDKFLLCDIGNTSFSFLIEDKIKKFSINNKITLNYSGLVFYISVNEKATKKLNQTFKKTINLAPFFKIKSNYCKNLGIDRAALIYDIKDGIVADFGSAITIDIVKNDNHLGGYIMPGFTRLKKLYPIISPKLDFKYNLSKNLPNCTDEAISNAIFDMITLPIINLQKKYNLPLIFTGGEGEYFAKQLNVRYEEKLIFNNMKKIIDKNFNQLS